MSDLNLKEAKVIVADPSALGLFGLAMVTLVASSQKLGITSGFAFIIPVAIFLGAFAQLFACINDSKRNNIFGATVFGAYSFFWMITAFIWLIKVGALGEYLSSGVDARQLGFVYIGYLVFSLLMTIGSLETNKMLMAIFIFIDILFIGLVLSSFGILTEFSHIMAGISELLIGLLSFYGCGAIVLNEHFGRVFLPVGAPLGIFKNKV